MLEFLKQIEEYDNLKEGWDGRDGIPPGYFAIENSKRMLCFCCEFDIKPHGVFPIAEGGVALVWSTSKNYSEIECFCKGGMLGYIHEFKKEPDIFEILLDEKSMREGIVKIKNFWINVKKI